MREISDNQLFRAELSETDDSGDQQGMILKGRHGEQLGGKKRKVPRILPHGFNSHSPKGAHVWVMVIGGNPSQSAVIGGESAGARFKNLAEGEVAVYNGSGDYIHLKANGDLIIQAARVIVESNDINLGGLGGLPVMLQGGTLLPVHPSTRVKGI